MNSRNIQCCLERFVTFSMRKVRKATPLAEPLNILSNVFSQVMPIKGTKLSETLVKIATGKNNKLDALLNRGEHTDAIQVAYGILSMSENSDGKLTAQETKSVWHRIPPIHSFFHKLDCHFSC